MREVHILSYFFHSNLPLRCRAMNIESLLERQSPEPTLHSLESPGHPSYTQQSPLQPKCSSNSALIPCNLDLKTGSSEEADKRRANSAASRRFRERKRKETQYEQLVKDLQNENQFLLKLCGFLGSERDYYRENLDHYVPLSQLPPRPPTPQPIASTPPQTTTPSARSRKNATSRGWAHDKLRYSWRTMDGRISNFQFLQ